MAFVRPHSRRARIAVALDCSYWWLRLREICRVGSDSEKKKDEERSYRQKWSPTANVYLLLVIRISHEIIETSTWQIFNQLKCLLSGRTHDDDGNVTKCRSTRGEMKTNATWKSATWKLKKITCDWFIHRRRNKKSSNNDFLFWLVSASLVC